MLAGFLLAMREGVEAALIIGIVLSTLRKINRGTLSLIVWRGVLAAGGFSLLAGLVLFWLGVNFEGRSEEIFEGVVMLAAAGLLTWMIFWMRRHSAALLKDLADDVRKAAITKDSPWALFWLSFLAVGREGFELALFLVASQMATGSLQTFLGATLGIAAASILGWIFSASTRRLNLRQFFMVTNILLILFASGLIARSIHEFNEAGIIPSVVEHVWDLNPILNEEQITGQLLAALFGYNANPSLTEIIAYLAYILGLGFIWKKFTGLKYTKQASQSG